MHRIFGIVLFVSGTGFLLMGGYLLYTEYMAGRTLLDWEDLLFATGISLFGYLLTITGYRMSREERF